MGKGDCCYCKFIGITHQCTFYKQPCNQVNKQLALANKIQLFVWQTAAWLAGTRWKIG